MTTEKFGGDNEPPRYTIPESIQKEIDAIDENSFWKLENLTELFEHDITFGMKMWGGLYEAVRRNGAIRAELEDFNELTEKILLSSTSPEDAAHHLLDTKKWLIDDWHISPAFLTAKVILQDAYISEAKAMEGLGIDPEQNPPFKTSIGLRKDHPEVQEYIQQENKRQVQAGGEMIDSLVKNSSYLKKLVEGLDRKNQPPDGQPES